MNFGLIIIGDEILSGKREDKHLPKVIELLAANASFRSAVMRCASSPT